MSISSTTTTADVCLLFEQMLKDAEGTRPPCAANAYYHQHSPDTAEWVVLWSKVRCVCPPTVRYICTGCLRRYFASVGERTRCTICHTDVDHGPLTGIERIERIK